LLYGDGTKKLSNKKVVIFDQNVFLRYYQPQYIWSTTCLDLWFWVSLSFRVKRI